MYLGTAFPFMHLLDTSDQHLIGRFEALSQMNCPCYLFTHPVNLTDSKPAIQATGTRQPPETTEVQTFRKL